MVGSELCVVWIGVSNVLDGTGEVVVLYWWRVLMLGMGTCRLISLDCCVAGWLCC